MPEQHIEDFTAATSVENGDVWHIQRLGGVWTDYKVRNQYMFGQDFATKRATYLIQDILSAAQQFTIAAGAGNIWLPNKTYAIYTPGTVNDGLTVQLRGNLGYEAGPFSASASFVFNSDVQGSSLRGTVGSMSMLNNTTWTFSFGADATGTTSNGTITVFAAFVAVSV